MARLNEAELTDMAAKYASEYIFERFKTGRDIEKSLILNTVAHGYYMGARRYEEVSTPKWWWFFIKPMVKTERLVDYKGALDRDSVKASRAYIKAKKYQNMSFSELALVRASLCGGFVVGYIARKRLDSEQSKIA